MRPNLDLSKIEANLFLTWFGFLSTIIIGVFDLRVPCSVRVLSSLSPLATMVLAFYFANKAAQQAQAAASA